MVSGDLVSSDELFADSAVSCDCIGAAITRECFVDDDWFNVAQGSVAHLAVKAFLMPISVELDQILRQNAVPTCAALPHEGENPAIPAHRDVLFACEVLLREFCLALIACSARLVHMINSSTKQEPEKVLVHYEPTLEANWLLLREAVTADWETIDVIKRGGCWDLPAASNARKALRVIHVPQSLDHRRSGEHPGADEAPRGEEVRVARLMQHVLVVRHVGAELERLIAEIALETVEMPRAPRDNRVIAGRLSGTDTAHLAGWRVVRIPRGCNGHNGNNS